MPQIPDSTPLADYSGAITAYRLSDGIQTLTHNNSAIFTANFATDAGGNITLWDFDVSSPFPASVGNPASAITSDQANDSVGFGTCTSVASGVCSTIGGVTDSGNTTGNPAGTWEMGASLPTLSQWGMIIFMVLAGIGSLYYLRRRRIEV
ncbi:MAG: IPTL-CTERM sorting domain-containing protein [Planctomycetota bacterium]|jgi:hypothetical protein